MKRATWSVKRSWHVWSRADTTVRAYDEPDDERRSHPRRTKRRYLRVTSSARNVAIHLVHVPSSNALFSLFSSSFYIIINLTGKSRLLKIHTNSRLNQETLSTFFVIHSLASVEVILKNIKKIFTTISLLIKKIKMLFKNSVAEKVCYLLYK